MPETHTYAPWQLAEVRRQLTMGKDLDRADVLNRAAKMGSLPLATVKFLCKNDEVCAALAAGKADPRTEQTEVPDNPAPPDGPEGS